MKHQLSILIPTYNNVCVQLVRSLSEQAEAITELRYEILVANDGSTNVQTTTENRQINNVPHCRYIINKHNVGRSTIRNQLAEQANYSLLLFIDSGVDIGKHDFLCTYISLYYTENSKCVIASGAKQSGKYTQNNSNNRLLRFTRNDEQALLSNTYNKNFGVVCGGYTPIIIGANTKSNLRYMYEKKHEKANSTEKRTLKPYKSFRTVNFMISRDLMLSHPFDINIREYGYEDVMFGKELSANNVSIKHINNPVIYPIHDTNEQFIAKTEAALRTLAAHKSEMKGYSSLLSTAQLLHKLRLSVVLNAIFKTRIDKWRATLCGNHPTLFLFNLYRLCYLLNSI